MDFEYIVGGADLCKILSRFTGLNAKEMEKESMSGIRYLFQGVLGYA